MKSTILLLSILTFGACQAEQDQPLTKAEAAQLDGKSDSGVDLCEFLGWYDDGICDTFCLLPDPDCGEGPACADPNDPEVHYVGESVGECAAILFACEPWQTGFSDECGCGCLGPEEEPPTFCGGFANIQCADGLTCVDDPSDDCELGDGADCGGICVETAPDFCGGFGNIQCADGFECVDDPSDDCQLGDGADCGGICVEETPDACPDPNDPEVHYVTDTVNECLVILFACEPWQTGFSNECGCGCLGPEQAAFCGGFANFQCKDGFECVDDPNDDCQFGDGADCGGMCVVAN